jgi:hypothetical protein
MGRAATAKAPGKGQQYREVPPNAAKTLYALRDMGYDNYSAIMDLVDNSIDAKATRVDVHVKEPTKGNIIIDIVDDGVGMDEPTLAQALRLGSDTERTTGDLGKFGMGLVTASISLAKCVWVITRQKEAAAWEANFDLNTIERENKFIITLAQAKSDKVLSLLGKHGTAVKLSLIDRINDTNVQRFARNLRERLGQTYRHFIDAGLSLYVNRQKVDKVDPLMLGHELTQRVLDQDIHFGDKQKARLIVVELPELGQAGDAEANITPHNSGFYVCRNGREILAAQTFGFYQRHHSYSHFRAELSFTGDLDTLFHVDIKKAVIHPDDRLLEKLRAKTASLIANAGKRGREREEGKPVVKLSHDLAASRIAAALPKPPAPIVPPDKLEQVSSDGKAKPKTKGKGGKAEAPPLDIIEKDKTAQVPPPPPAPSFEFRHTQDADPAGRYFTVVKQDGKVIVEYNDRHPLVRMVGEARQKQAAALLDFYTFALAQTELALPSGAACSAKVNEVLTSLVTEPTPAPQA